MASSEVHEPNNFNVCKRALTLFYIVIERLDHNLTYAKIVFFFEQKNDKSKISLFICGFSSTSTTNQ